MPQNFRTRTVRLHQRQYLTLRDFPVYQVDARRQTPWGRNYQVVDVTLHDGTRHTGLLVRDSDSLLVPLAAPAFEAADIADIRPTPSENIPDFTITDPEAIWEAHGIEWGNAWRLALFGPEEEKDWRAVPIDEAHEKALSDERRVRTYDGEIPACYDGPGQLVLTRGGIRMSYVRVRDDQCETVTIRPKNADLWADLLDESFAIDPSFTLGEMIALLDLPPEVDREVYLRTMPYRHGSFRPWVDAVREEGYEHDADLEYIEVGAYAENDDGELTFFFDATGIGRPLEADDALTGFKAGERVNYSLAYGGPARLRNIPLRYNPELVIPVTHEEHMAFLRGPLHDWHVAGEVGPRPEMPVLLRAKRSITLGEFIRALFSELSSINVQFDEDEREAGDA